jgi:hypothetical protein
VTPSTKVFTIIAVILLLGGGWTLHRANTARWVVLMVPITLQTGSTISQDFSVDLGTSYFLEIECERTPDTGGDLNDALIDGLEIEAKISANGRPIKNISCSPKAMMWRTGYVSRILCTFDAQPGNAYHLALHIVRYGQGLSSRDHKLAGTWDENLTIPQQAHPMLKVEADLIASKGMAMSMLLLIAVGLICLISPLRFFLLKLFRR